MNKICKLLAYVFIAFSMFFINSRVLAYETDNMSINKSLVSSKLNVPLMSECEYIFGKTTNEKDPAYWINWAMIIIKYVAIIAVLVLSSFDFVKAIVSQDNDALKKATQTSLKRLIFAVIIFFVPIIVNLVLSLFGVVGCTFGE